MAATRKYELKKRADEMAETRRRIAAAAVELHGSVGPSRTTLSAIAERAGVQRHTVYRHFPTDADLYGACSAHYMEANPLPDPGPWREIGDPRERVARALDDLYAYYERTEPMFSNVLRDVGLVEALGPAMQPWRSHFAEMAEILASGWPGRGPRRRVLTAAVHHVIDFHTWRSLTVEGRVTRAEAVELACALVEGAAAPRARAAA